MKSEYLHDAEVRQTAAFAILAEYSYFTRLPALSVTFRYAERPRTEISQGSNNANFYRWIAFLLPLLR